MADSPRSARRHARPRPPLVRRRAVVVACTTAVSLAAGFLTAAAVQGVREPGVSGSVPSSAEPAVGSRAGRAPGPGATPSAAGAGTRAASPTPEVPACTPAPLEVRAAAVLVVGLPGVTDVSAPLAQELLALGVGGVFIADSSVVSERQVTGFVADLQAAAPRPLVVATDEESGRVADMRAVVGAGQSPRRMAQRLTPAEVRADAAETGAELAAVGITLDLAPVLDLDDGPWDGIVGDRSFSADPQVAAEYGLAFAAGLTDAGVLPTVKHFPGHGRSADDSHTTSARVSAGLDDLRTTDLAPFQAAIDAGAPVVMLNHLRYDALDPDLPASLSPSAYALLRDMGFEGVAMTDSVGMGAVNQTWDFPDAAVRAVAAGADAVLAVQGQHAVRMRDALVAAVRAGTLPEERLSEAAARVTALAGGDPWPMSCLDIDLPDLVIPPAAAP